VPAELYHDEWERRRLRNQVHLTIGGCLGPCALANVVELIFDGRTVFFHSVDDEATVRAIYDYLDQMVAADTYVPPPPALAGRQFTQFRWEGRPDGVALQERARTRTAAEPGILFLTHADTDLLALRAALPRQRCAPSRATRRRPPALLVRATMPRFLCWFGAQGILRV